MIVQVYNYLIANPPTGFTSANLYYSRLPDSPDYCAVLLDGGGTSVHTASGGLAVYEVRRLQVQVRGTTYAEVVGGIEAFESVLGIVGNQTLSGVFYQRIMADTVPVELQPDDENRYKISQTFTVMKERG